MKWAYRPSIRGNWIKRWQWILFWKCDQGSHFTSSSYINLLKEHPSVQISMDSKRRALDNIRIERFWRNLKYEEVYLKNYETPREARNNIKDYMILYNHERPQQALDYKTPGSVYFQ